MTDNFKTWADMTFIGSKGRADEFVQLSPIYADYIEFTGGFLPLDSFKWALDEWCEDQGFEMNPDRFINAKFNRIMLTVNVEILAGGFIVKSKNEHGQLISCMRECIYVQTKAPKVCGHECCVLRSRKCISKGCNQSQVQMGQLTNKLI